MAGRRSTLGLAAVLVAAGTLGGGLALQYASGLSSDEPKQHPTDISGAVDKMRNAGPTQIPMGGGDSKPEAQASGMDASVGGAFDRHFQAAVKLLQSGRPAEALGMLRMALRSRPHIPEIHVNIGFALLKLDRPAEAQRAFDKTLELRPEQLNAYYGLAESLERQGDLWGALGAMRTYIHLVDENDPFRIKAMAATWEWQAAIDKKDLPTKEHPLASENGVSK